MNLRLNPESEEKIKKILERGPYKTHEEVVERAIIELHEREDWLAQHREEIAQKIEEGWQSAEEARPVDVEEVKAAMEIRNKAWLEKNREPESPES